MILNILKVKRDCDTEKLGKEIGVYWYQSAASGSCGLLSFRPFMLEVLSFEKLWVLMGPVRAPGAVFFC